ncbi:CBY1-interacting BAR domain-containing protein 2 isoform X2 [Kryptolebias marmoratus]|uniref:CBY1-interacting BAR domain-containing protein 2 isoform X2 n=1 Tax=Kryptolebias marmoratus TaxID=37003 RepID=UPI0007F8B739|nr:CBY1-interacting BAR domain-containing protein 2 isoform X2 [Kryptolebias marmoratus]
MNSLSSRRDAQVQSMEQTLKHAEKNLGEICSILASYTRKTAKLRDKADLLVAQLFDFSTTEGPEFQVGLKNLAEDLAMVQDYRQAQVERLETRVVAPLKAYGDIIKNKKIELKKFSADLNREQKELQKLEKVRQRSPADRQTISQAEVSAQKASSNVQHSTKRLEETVVNFQGQKLEDIKKIFLDFITVEMHFHAKALEVYTHTHYNLEAMDAQKDLQLFSSRITMSDSQAWPLNSNSSPLMTHYSRFPLTSSKGQGLSSMQTSKTGQSHREQHSQLEELANKPHSNLKRQAGMEEEEEEKVEQEEEEEEEDEEESEAETELRARTSRQSYAAQYAQMYRWQK